VVFFSPVSTPVPVSEDEILAVCEAALRLAPSEWLPDLQVSNKLLGTPEWYSFEHDAWPLGESIRRAFLRYPRLKKRTSLISKIVDVATCRNLRHGRQSFIMALGFVAASQFAPKLVPFLDDSDVDGQVVYTLLKMRSPGYADAVAPLTQSNKAWIRRLAKRYMERYG